MSEKTSFRIEGGLPVLNPTTDEPRIATPTEVARSATLVASLTEAPSASGDEVRALSELADCLEVRADLVGDVGADWLRERFAGELLYTLRSEAEGGRGTVEPERRAALLSAARGYDFVDIEADRDLGRAVLDVVEPRRRLVSWHGRARNLKVLQGRLRQVSGVEARLYKLVTEAQNSGDELVPLELLLGAGRGDVAAFSMGAIGAWTRLVAPRLGAPWIYGAAGPLAAAPGQPPVERLRVDYGLPNLRRASRLFGVVGHPAAHSLSPRLHNSGYRDRGEEALYVAFDAPSFETFWREVVLSDFFDRAGLPLSGLSVTAPHKAAALAAASEAGDLARGTQGANTLLPCRNGAASKRWRAESTDPEGVVGPLRRGGIDLEDRDAVVIGAGGAGRAAALGLAAAGARVVLANRTEATGRPAAEALGVAFAPLEELEPGGFDIVVNATSLGHRADDPLPCDPAALRSSAAAVELVYGGGPTPWGRALAARGLVVVDGREVLLHQGLSQFEAMIGTALPFEVGAAALGLETRP
ncbi:MAG: type I 3-dehydroquinate dehydratase [Holophagales bacterium]|nr:type I 3-dehydroquinate dehydratase [Holophagales bacterium]MYD21217.1 type I 3-dehydroquinate dehydratase [Holophagales bacterium]MYI31647.1 type I 3-dehydroquinate dehydratase [Holophagales bacterium]